MFDHKNEIEQAFGDSLIWERLNEKRASRIKFERTEFNVFDKDCWDDMADFLVETMIRFEPVIKKQLKNLNHKLNKGDFTFPSGNITH